MSMTNQVHYTVRYHNGYEWRQAYRGVKRERALAEKKYHVSRGVSVQASIVAPNGRFMAKL